MSISELVSVLYSAVPPASRANALVFLQAFPPSLPTTFPPAEQSGSNRRMVCSVWARIPPKIKLMRKCRN